MKAIRIHEYGNSDVLRYEDAPRPDTGPDNVLIRVIASSVNPIEWKIREGRMKADMPRPMPFVLGWDASGIVETAGSNVSRFKPGDAVFTYPEFAGGGTHAEYVSVQQDQVALKPNTCSFVHAAALPMTGQAAWASIIDAGQVTSGQRILIHGAAGGLGSIAVQLAKWRGAYVIATASAENRNLVESLGADEVIDYRTTSFKNAVHDVDIVLDTIGGATQEDSWPVLKSGGLLVATAMPPSAERAAAFGARAIFVFTKPSGAVLQQLAALVDSGDIRPIIGAEFALTDAQNAQELSQSGHARGKIVLHVSQP